jgi:hypothetical protein
MARASESVSAGECEGGRELGRAYGSGRGEERGRKMEGGGRGRGNLGKGWGNRDARKGGVLLWGILVENGPFNGGGSGRGGEGRVKWMSGGWGGGARGEHGGRGRGVGVEVGREGGGVCIWRRADGKVGREGREIGGGETEERTRGEWCRIK